jgi:putative addiction module killer protein
VVDVREYLDRQGRSPYKLWFDRLNAQAAARVATALTRLSLGNMSNVKGVGSGVSELRIDFGPGYRVYFGKDGEQLVILLGGGTKQRQQRDISCRNRELGRLQTEKIREAAMPLTRDFKETIRDRVQRDSEFRKELLREGLDAMLSGDITLAKTILRDYINATVGFTGLAAATHIPPKSLMRMLGPAGNPRAVNLFEIVSFLQHREGVRYHVRASSP